MSDVIPSNGQDVIGALCARDYKGVGSQYIDEGKVVCQRAEGGMASRYIVRRLTPRETERLQGFPDDWTDLTGCDVDAVTEKVAASLLYSDEEKERLRRRVRKWSQSCPDGARYKCTGNSFAVPVVRWIGERIQMVDDMVARMECE